MSKISIIVPVYNSEKELDRCIQSVIDQTYKNIEIILINDGSTDNSLEICEKYGAEYDFIKVLSQSNQGQSSARNKGIEAASGDLIGFVDSDDVIHPEMYNYLYTILDKHQADLSAIQVKTVKHMNEINTTMNDESVEIVDKTELLEDYMYDGLNKSAGQYSAGRKLFKKELLSEVRFLEGYIFEDILFNYEVLEQAHRLVKSEKIMYYYFQDSDSTMRRRFTEKELDLLYICDLIIEKTKKENNANLTEYSEMKKARSYFSLLAKIAYFDTNIETQRLNKIKKNLVSGLRANYKLLIKSPIPINRKVIITAFVLNFNLSAKLIQMVKK